MLCCQAGWGVEAEVGAGRSVQALPVYVNPQSARKLSYILSCCMLVFGSFLFHFTRVGAGVRARPWAVGWAGYGEPARSAQSGPSSPPQALQPGTRACSATRSDLAQVPHAMGGDAAGSNLPRLEGTVPLGASPPGQELLPQGQGINSWQVVSHL